MARPWPAMPPAAAILALADGEGRLAIRVTPNASADAIALTADGVAIRTTAAPEDGRANEAVLRLLAKAIGRPASALELVRGATARAKLVRVRP